MREQNLRATLVRQIMLTYGMVNKSSYNDHKLVDNVIFYLLTFLLILVSIGRFETSFYLGTRSLLCFLPFLFCFYFVDWHDLVGPTTACVTARQRTIRQCTCLL